MKLLTFLLTAAAALAATPALAQDAGAPAPSSTPARDAGVPAAPDGTAAFGIEPYVAIMGGYEDFDSDNRGVLTTNCNGRSGCPDGGFVEGILGVNIPVGPVFIGAEGSIAKGFKGIDYEYAAWGRAGFRAGDTGLIYGKVGYQWVHTNENGRKLSDREISYGLGVEVGPKSIGLGGLTPGSLAGARLRLDLSTLNFKNIRPAAGVVFHF